MPRRAGVALFGLALAGLAVGLAIVEGVARVVWVDPLSVKRELRPRLVDPTLPTIRTVLELVTPHQRGIHKGRLYRTNAEGVRGPEYTPEPAPGVFRIVVAGDSVTMGAGVEEEEAYPARLEEQLNIGAGPWRYEVVNLGISGSNSTVIVRRLQRIGLGYHPHLVVYGYTLNDIEGPAYEGISKDVQMDQLQKEYSRLMTSRWYAVRLIGPRLLAVRDMIRPPPGSYLQELFHNYFDNPPAWEAVAADLARLADMARRGGVCGHLFLHKQLTRVGIMHPFEPIYEKVTEAARQRGLTVSSSHTYLQDYDEESLRISVWDQHPNPLGHELQARALRDALLELPDDCWRTADGELARPPRDRSSSRP
jgi:lysophospholipase L1-like esterase